MDLARRLWDGFACVCPREVGAHGGAAGTGQQQYAVPQGSWQGEGTGSPPATGTRSGDRDMPRLLARGDVLESRELQCLSKKLGY